MTDPLLRQTEQQLEVALQAARMGTWALDLRTNELTTSEHCRKDYGWPVSQPMTNEDLLGLIHPDDQKMRVELIQRALATRADLEVEYRVNRPDGEQVWILVRGRAEYGADGVPFYAQGVSLDITDRKRAEERQRSLVAELNHRVKNTLAIVQSLALQTHRTTESPVAFMEALTARVRSLAKAHDLLTENSWEGALLKDVIGRTLEPYAADASAGRRIEISGPPVRLNPQTAVVLNMAFHELVTNAAKYGALSTPGGAISVVWNIDVSSDPALIEIVWSEAGGPRVHSPTRRGFGSHVLEAGLAHELGGKVVMEFPPEGFVCRMRYVASDRMHAPA
ncbi:MAG: HWE histidine kinase domain-containing protein [Hyphomonadaceae bacterium]|nr:HWE histidine kinase domain-containing protein [Hyphomonadaceae bacterium]